MLWPALCGLNYGIEVDSRRLISECRLKSAGIRPEFRAEMFFSGYQQVGIMSLTLGLELR